mmetsp:Transcript_28872/g.42786  ORF Transcript_28872/g.42786 Transcript_28872/m.42786 type:complete len:115 (+) Transcript_28872:83-427(+)|eukprot:CAMPEP_0195523428 /NCGR_PEP_ID=MMETSP0794_2-20130614/22613_1 /TAXON_ID=515487 /ORGANISM="Stephanopyxis turris, Strain CCMP 815" /LENGTH=114 /DNA_ID=CAMNT_0040653431 /DNA_START=72 /DNA_END=416 /DNA_ORIENTATION=-
MAEVPKLLAVMGDEDTVTGFLLAGAGHRDARSANYLIVDGKTKTSAIVDKFKELTSRDDVGILLINQNVAEEIREVLNLYDQMYPTILEIPSKDHPYSAEKDYIMKRVMHMLGK